MPTSAACSALDEAEIIRELEVPDRDWAVRQLHAGKIVRQRQPRSLAYKLIDATPYYYSLMHWVKSEASLESWFTPGPFSANTFEVISVEQL